MSETKKPVSLEWIHDPTEEPLSLELRAAVIEDLKDSWYFAEAEDFRRYLQFTWMDEGSHQAIRNSTISLRLDQVHRLCNNLTVFYWMPSPQVDEKPLHLDPFGCIYTEWVRYHNDRLPVESGCFFAHLVRVYPTGPTKTEEVITVHKSFCQQAVALIEDIKSGEAKHPNGRPWSNIEEYHLSPT